MVDVKRLDYELSRKDMNRADAARKLNMNPSTFYRKLKRGVLDSDEIEALMVLLDIEDPMPIFFASSGA